MNDKHNALFDFRSGAIKELYNGKIGKAISFGKHGMSWRLEVETDISDISITADECDLICSENDSAVFFNYDLNIQISISLIPIDTDVVGIKISVKNNNESLIVRKLIIENIEPVQFTTTKGDDILVYPSAGGMQIKNPTNELFKEVECETAVWNDRQLSVRKKGFSIQKDNTAELAFSYSGRCSMQWMDYYSKDCGLYLAMHDENFEHGELAAIAHSGKDGLCFRLEKIFNRNMKEISCTFAIGFHSGDWHRGADIYRSFFDKVKMPLRKVPEIFSDEPGMVCHYDFKWQNGEVNHHFSDLPLLAKEAQEAGFNLITVAGWNNCGFDNHYPDFRPDPELGTELDLKKAIDIIHKMGVKIFLYNNAYSFDSGCKDYYTYGAEWAVRKKDNEVLGVKWGDRVLVGMCNSVEGWRKRVKDNIKYVVDELNADGVYIDQLAVSPKVCYSSNHQHKESWIKNNVNLIKEITDELGEGYRDKIFLFSEWLTDLLHTQLDGQLIHTCWLNGIDYGFPEMYRYTFPEVLCFDQVFQKPWGGNPAEVEEEFVQQIICRYFINGIKFWTYDHTLTNPRVGEFFKNVIRLTNSTSEIFNGGQYRDEEGIVQLPEGIYAKTYSLVDGIAVAVWNRTGVKNNIRLLGKNSGMATAYLLDGKKASYEFCNNKLEVPKDELSVFVLVIK
jgi:hypothetical protein